MLASFSPLTTNNGSPQALRASGPVLHQRVPADGILPESVGHVADPVQMFVLTALAIVRHSNGLKREKGNR